MVKPHQVGLLRGFKNQRGESLRTDEGISLIEVIVALTVFAVIAAATSVALLRIHGGLKDNERRVQATNVAQTQIEAARAQSAAKIPNGVVQFSRTVGNVVYQVHQQTEYVASVDVKDQCSAQTSNMAYKSVQVRVTWDNMGSVKPVYADTAIALKPGEFQSSVNTGGMVIRVRGIDGKAISGAKVEAAAAGQPAFVKFTGSSGCTVFTSLPTTAAGVSYQVTVQKPQFAAADGSPQATVAVVVRPSIIQQVAPITLGPVSAVSARISFGPAAPSPGTVLHYRGESDASWTILPTCTTGAAGSATPCVSADLRQVTGLVDGKYSFGVSACSAQTPQESQVVEVQAGNTAPVAALPLARVALQPRDRNGAPLPAGYTAVMDHAGCKNQGSNNFRYSFPTNGSPTITAWLPQGNYFPNVFVNGGPEPSTGGRQVTVPPGNQSTTVPLQLLN